MVIVITTVLAQNGTNQWRQQRCHGKTLVCHGKFWNQFWNESNFLQWSILPTFYEQLLHQFSFAKKIQTWAIKSCSKDYCTKKLLVKCWWNRHLGSISSNLRAKCKVQILWSTTPQQVGQLFFYWWLYCLFALLRSELVKAAPKHVDEIEPCFPRSTNNNGRTLLHFIILFQGKLYRMSLRFQSMKCEDPSTSRYWIRSARQHFQSLCVWDATLFKGRKIKKSFLLFFHHFRRLRQKKFQILLEQERRRLQRSSLTLWNC